MTFITPIAFLIGLLAIPILVLYMLKLRRRAVEVSSNLLWERLLRDRQANHPWQRLKRNILLFLQLLILGLLVLALGRPAISLPVAASGPMIVLLDGSASMNATDVMPTRFDAARDFTRTLVSSMGRGDAMTLILVADQPVVLASEETEKANLMSALESAASIQGPAAWDAAFALAAGASLVQNPGSDRSSTIIILSDGGLPTEQLPSLPGEVRFFPFGTSNNNVAVTALALRPTGDSAQLFAALSNYSEQDRQLIFSIYRNGDLYNAQQVAIPALDHTSVTLTDLPATPAVFQARLTDPTQVEQSLDDFGLDDSAFAVLPPATTGRTLLITPGNIFLEQVLAVLPNLVPFQLEWDDPANIKLPDDAFDLYVYDGVYPTGEELPPGNLLFVNPPSNPLFNITTTYTFTSNIRIEDHPLVSGIDPDTIHIFEISQIELPLWATALITSDQGPLVFAGETQGRRIAVISFDLHASDLPMQIAFPILIANLAHYLVPPQSFDAPNGLHPGESLSILPASTVQEIVINSPSGITYAMPPGENSLLFTNTDEIGLYAVNYLSASDPRVEYFAVNLFNAGESDIQPRQTIQIGRYVLTASAQDEIALHELWPWLTGAALLILALEWWVYHGMQRFPDLAWGNRK